MSVEWCPVCAARFMRDPQSGDFVHACNSGEASIDNESVVVIGSWEDYTGSGTVQSAHTTVAGLPNDLFGTDAQVIDNAKDESRDVRGKSTSIYRSRKRLSYVPPLKKA